MSCCRRACLATALFFLLPFRAGAFEAKDMAWAEMPVQYFVNPEGCPILTNAHGYDVTIADMVEEAAEAWSSVSCADVSFQFMGTTEAEWAPDQQNTIYCIKITDDWTGGDQWAGATIWMPHDVEGYYEFDLAMNGVDFEWVLGGADAVTSDAFDPVAVMTHELGHVLGLAHSPEPFATMYFGSLPGGIQATLEADDKAGICYKYPVDDMECASDADCPDSQWCQTIEGFSVCGDKHDPPGAFCNKDHLNCEGMCWISPYECQQFCYPLDLLYMEGYCAAQCDDAGECPLGFLPTDQPIGVFDVCLCLIDPDYQPPEPDPESAPEAAFEPAFEPGPEAVVEAVEAGPWPEAPDAITSPSPDWSGEVEVSPSQDLVPGDSKPHDDSKKSSGCAAVPSSGSSPLRDAVPLLLALCLVAGLRRRLKTNC